MKKSVHVILIFIGIFSFLFAFPQGTLISNFGSNPGNIRAYKYVPADMPNDAPLVVVIHGCGEDAAEYSQMTGWNTLADEHKFYVVHAEQKSANNSSTCFNYWEPGDHNRGQGEGYSIKQTVDYMKSNYSIDSTRVFVSGLSAGGAMTIVMLSAYPEVFAAGAEMAGLPYKVATSSAGVALAAIGAVSKTPQEWGNLVRGQNPNYTGKYPRLAIFHGTSDIVINDNNANESVKQFTNLHGTDQTADHYDGTFNGDADIKLRQYFDASSNVVVEYFAFEGMAHGIAVNPGSCYDEGGTTVSVAFDVGFYSSFYAAKFFGILQPPFAISGADTVEFNQQDVGFSAPADSGATYEWQVPADATITNGAGTSSIAVTWGDSSGILRVTETLANGCVNPVVELNVTAVEPAPTGVATRDVRDEHLFLRQHGNKIEFLLSTQHANTFTASLTNLSGQTICNHSGLISNQYHLIAQELSPGIYILGCLTSGNKIQTKFTIGMNLGRGRY